MALLTVTAALAGWWLGASLPLDISDTTRQIAALLTASACTWILYIVSRKVLYNPQIQISAESGTKRSIFRQKNKTKRSKNRLHTTLIKPEQKVNEDLCSGFVLS